jgi:alkyl hydroperoxide reductase subunit AhpC
MSSLRDRLEEFKRNKLDVFHDEFEYRLPMSARYIIDSSRIIRAADVNADYTIRPEPSDTLRLLRTLEASDAAHG